VVADNLRFVCMAPPYRVLTRDARRALPAMVPTSTVSWQVGRCLAMVSAMAKGDPDAIRACCHDRIHEPYRAPLIPDYQMLHDVAHENGACTFLISGSGATMMAIADGDERAASVARAVSEAMPTALGAHAARERARHHRARGAVRQREVSFFSSHRWKSPEGSLLTQIATIRPLRRQ
jgi:homoserine kinase